MNRELIQRIYKLSQNKPNELSSAFSLADLVPWVHLQFANLLEKQTSKKYIFYKSTGKYNLPIWKVETTLLKMHTQLTYKQNEKQYYKHTCSSL